MIVTAIHNTRNVLPEIIRDDAYGYSPNGILPITIGKDYVVAAIIDNIKLGKYYLIIPDDGELKAYPWSFPAQLFETKDDYTPEDWETYTGTDYEITGFPEITHDPDGKYFNNLEDGAEYAIHTFLKHFDKYAKHHNLKTYN